MPQERKLAAIMFTDIVGYTALMGSDEKKAFELLRRNRNIQKHIISKYRGKWLKEMGDGILASFDSASDAVRCAGEIQRKAVAEGIGLRIGIHLGEVVFEDNDVLGDGVNIASRLEEIAEAGSIYISGVIYKNVKNKEGITTEFLGDKTFKNIDEPVNVYKVQFEVKAQEQEELSENTLNKRSYYKIGGVLILIVAVVLIWFFYPRKQSVVEEEVLDKSIAVIPFWNDSPDPENEYFCRGMEEEIRTQLSKIEVLQVESRQSVEKYRQNTEKDLISIGKELGVSYVVEGSVRKLGDDVRVTVQLIDSKTSKHIWSDTYDGNYTEKLLTFQSNTAKRIASSLNTAITPEEERKIDRPPTSDIRAYDFMIRGRNEISKYWMNRNIESLKLAHKLIDKALEIDPQYVDAIAAKSGIYIAEQKYDTAFIYAKSVLEIDPEAEGGYWAMGEYYRFTNNQRAAIENYELALKYYDADNFISKSAIKKNLGALYCSFNNDYKKGLKFFQEAINELDTVQYGYWGNLGEIFLDLGDYDKAHVYNQKLLEFEYENTKCWGIIITSMTLIAQGKYNDGVNYADSICSVTLCESQCSINLFYFHTLLGHFGQSERYFQKCLDIGASWVLDSLMLAYTYRELGRNQEAKIILNKKRITLEKKLFQSDDWLTYTLLSMTQALLEKKDESLKNLSDAVKQGLRYGWHDFLPVCPFYKEYWDDPEFKNLVKKAQEERLAKRKQVEEMIERGEINL